MIEAAGGVLWRPAVGGAGIEVALVHRPKYDDWSFPKGKLRTGEHRLLGALREVLEETGFAAIPGPPLGAVRYLMDGAPKRVRYWSLRATDGQFVPSDEVDQIMWLPPREAARHLAPGRDRPVLRRFTKLPGATWPFLLIRHGSAGDRAVWVGDDTDRPLDETGHRQAGELVPLLTAYGVERVVSADVLRCLDTVGPYAAKQRLAVESEPLLSETGFPTQPEQAYARVVDLLSSGAATAACSQGPVIPTIIERLLDDYGDGAPDDASLRKGGIWVLHVVTSEPLRITGCERFNPA